MLKRVDRDPRAASPDGDDTLPMTSEFLHPPRPLAVPVPERSWRERIRAALVHLLLSGMAALLVTAVVLLAWYPDPLHRMLGVGAILWIVLGVDVVLGPLFTLIVYDRRKKRLKWDLATIAALQLAALAYGLFTIHQGRPAFVVLVKDRFEVISPADLRIEERAAARGNPFARIDPTGPRWVAARMPETVEQRNAIMFESVENGRDVQHHPALYVDYTSQTAEALERALPISRLRSLNPLAGAEIDALVARTGQAESALRYLPLRGPASDGAVVVGHPDGRILEVSSLQPW
jgi:hypothetical protein